MAVWVCRLMCVVRVCVCVCVVAAHQQHLKNRNANFVRMNDEILPVVQSTCLNFTNSEFA